MFLNLYVFFFFVPTGYINPCRDVWAKDKLDASGKKGTKSDILTPQSAIFARTAA
jgi:hypothetical protein